MTDITNKEAEALVSVLSMVENHPLWLEPRGYSEAAKNELYGAIMTVRQFLKRNDVRTLYAVTEELAFKHRLEQVSKRIDANQPWRHA